MDITKGKLIGQGNTAEVYQYGENKILKLFRQGLDLRVIEQEYDNSSMAVELLKELVPHVYEKVTADGRTGIVYEQVSGRDMLKRMMTCAWKLNRYSRDMARYHHAVHITTQKKLVTVKEKLQSDISRAEILSGEKKAKLARYLETLPGGSSFCHFDFHPGNVMLCGSRPVILDWMTACIGDPCADIARTCILLKYAEIPNVNRAVNLLAGSFQRHIGTIYLKECLKITGFVPEEIAKWELPIAAARLSEWIPENEKKKLMQLTDEGCRFL